MLSLDQPRTFALHVRHPGWVGDDALTVTVNGEAVATNSTASSYAVLQREWQDGDRVEVTVPMSTTLERLPDGSDYAAVMHGPIMLAAKTGTEDLDGLIADDARMAHVAPGPFRSLDAAPMLVGDADAAAMAAHIEPVEGEPMRFTAADLIRPNKFDTLELEPFFRVHDARYMMYWRLVTPEGYDQVVADLRASEEARLALETRTVDLVTPGEQQPEVEHDYDGNDSYTGYEFGRAWRAANDWFGYTLNARGESNLVLQLTHWGNAWRAESFDVEINGEVVTTVEVSGRDGEHFITKTVDVPTTETSELAVRFIKAEGSARVPPLYEVRLVKAE